MIQHEDFEVSESQQLLRNKNSDKFKQVLFSGKGLGSGAMCLVVHVYTSIKGTPGPLHIYIYNRYIIKKKRHRCISLF